MADLNCTSSADEDDPVPSSATLQAPCAYGAAPDDPPFEITETQAKNIHAKPQHSQSRLAAQALRRAVRSPRYTALHHAKQRRDRVWKPAAPLRREPQNPAHGLRLFRSRPFYGGSSGRARALPVLARGARSSNLFELPPPFGSGGGGFSKPHLLEAIHG